VSRPLNSDIATRINELSHLFPVLDQLSDSIDAAIALHSDDWEIEITEEEQTAALKAITGLIVLLDVNLACYPTGATTAILFDENGDPV